MAKYDFSNLAVSTSLSAGINDSVTSLTVADGTGYPTADFKIWVNSEIILVGTRTGTTFSSLTRGHDGTTAAAHSSGDAVRHVVTAEDLETRVLGVPVTSPGATEDEKVMVYDHDTVAFKWEDAATFGGAFLPLAGGTLSGDLDMGANNIRDIQIIYSETTDLYLRGLGPSGRSIRIQTDDSGSVLRNRLLIHGVSGDIEFFKNDGVTLSTYWDQSEDEWQWLSDLDMGGYILRSPADPTGGTHVGDRDYNDARYTLASGGPYLPLAGGTMTGDILLGGNNLYNVGILGGAAATALAVSSTSTLNLQSIPTGTSGSVNFYVNDAGGTSRLRQQFSGGDMVWYDSAVVEKLRWEDSTGFWEFSDDIDMQVNSITGVYYLSGDPTSATVIHPGAGQILYIRDDTDKTRLLINPNSSGDLVFYDKAGTPENLRWDESLGYWRFAATPYDNEYASYLANQAWVTSRGTNLVSNGYGTLQDNTNFSGFVYDADDSYSGGGSFSDTYTGTSGTTRRTDDLMPVDPSKSYRITYAAKSDAAGEATPSRHYSFIDMYDIDGLNIIPYMVQWFDNTETTLAADLNDTDTTITLTSAANWHDTDGNGNHQHSIVFFGYQNSFGYTYPDYTYSRTYLAAAWNDNAITGNVITLASAYSGPTIPSGTAVANCYSGSTFTYVGASNVITPADWTVYSGAIGGLNEPGSTGNSGQGFRQGTAYVKMGWLLNRDSTVASTTWIDAATLEVVPTSGGVTQNQANTFRIKTRSDGDTWTSQGGMIAIGEGADYDDITNGEPAMRMGYHGGGTGWVGMGATDGSGTITAGYPNSNSIRFNYTTGLIEVYNSDIRRLRFEDGNDIRFYDADGSTTSFQYDSSADNWLFYQGLEAETLILNAGDQSLRLNDNGTNNAYIGFYDDDVGRAGYMGLSSGVIYLTAEDRHLYLRAESTDGSSNVIFQASDSGGVIRNRFVVDGNGVVQVLDNTGVSQAQFEVSGALNLEANVLYNISDPTTGNQVGDRDYNDARYAIGATGDFVAVTGDTMTGDLLVDFADPTVIVDRDTQGGGTAMYYARTNGTLHGAFGLLSTLTDDTYLVAYDGSLRIDARNTGAASGDIVMSADDATGTGRARIFVDGDGPLRLGDNTGTYKFTLDDTSLDIDVFTDINFNGNSLRLKGTNSAYMTFYREGTVSTGNVGNSSTGSDAFFVQSTQGPLYLRAQSSGASAEHVYIQTDDDTGTLRLRANFDGDGNINFYEKDGLTASLSWIESGSYWDLRENLHLYGSDGAFDDQIYFYHDGTNVSAGIGHKTAASDDFHFRSFRGNLVFEVEDREDDTGASFILSIDDNTGTLRDRFIVSGATGNIVFYDNAGVEVLRYDDSTDDRWEFATDIDISIVDPNVNLDRTTQAGGFARVNFQTAGATTGYIGYASTSGDSLYLISNDESLVIRSAEPTGGNIAFEAHNTSGIINRFNINGNSGDIVFKDNSAVTTLWWDESVSSWLFENDIAMNQNSITDAFRVQSTWLGGYTSPFNAFGADRVQNALITNQLWRADQRGTVTITGTAPYSGGAAQMFDGNWDASARWNDGDSTVITIDMEPSWGTNGITYPGGKFIVAMYFTNEATTITMRYKDRDDVWYAQGAPDENIAQTGARYIYSWDIPGTPNYVTHFEVSISSVALDAEPWVTQIEYYPDRPTGNNEEVMFSKYKENNLYYNTNLQYPAELRLYGDNDNLQQIRWYWDGTNNTQYIGPDHNGNFVIDNIDDGKGVYLRNLTAGGTVNLWANDGTNTQRARMVINGSGSITFYQDDGNAILSLADGGTIDMQASVLDNIADPTADTHVGDRLYNDGRYALGAASDFVAVTGDTMTGTLILDNATQSLEVRAGDNTGASLGGDQITFGYNGADQYRHTIKTRHNSAADTDNSIDFYVWDHGTDAVGDIGTNLVLSVDSTGTNIHSNLEFNGFNISGLADPTLGTHVGDRDYNDGRYATLAGTAGYDTTAIHDNTASEISAIAAKATPTSADFLLIEDAAAANAKKRITIGDLPASGGSSTLDGLDDTIITTVADGEILVWSTADWINQTLTEAGILGLAGGTMTGSIDMAASTYIGRTSTTNRLAFDVATGDTTFYDSANAKTLEFDDTDDRWEFSKPAYREGTAALTTSQMRNIYIGSTAPGSPQTGDVWLDSASPLSTYLPLAGGTMTGDITFDTVATGLDYNNQGLSLNLGSKAVADDGVIPFIDFYSGSSVIGARIISSTDTGTSYSGGLQYRARAGHSFEGDLLSDTDLLYDLGSTSGAWANLYVQSVRDENGNLVWDVDGDMLMRGDQLFFNYGTETNSYLQHSTAGNYFRFVQAGSEAMRVTHGADTHLDLYGTTNSFVRKVEGGNLYIDNTREDNWIYLRTTDGAAIRSRIGIDGNGPIYFYQNTGTEVARIDTSGYIHNSGNRYYFGINSSDYIGFNQTSNFWQFVVAGTEYYRMDVNDATDIRFGIGDVSPDAALDIAGVTASNGVGGLIWQSRSTTSAAGTAVASYRNNSNVEVLKFWGDGDIVNTNGNYGSISDLRLKVEDTIVLARDYSDDLRDPLMAPRRYAFKDNPDKMLLGYVAQYVEQVKPGFVTNGKVRDYAMNEDGSVVKEMVDGKLRKKSTEREEKSVKTSAFIPMLHSGWIAHDDRIESLEAALETAIGEIETLTAKVEELEAR